MQRARHLLSLCCACEAVGRGCCARLLLTSFTLPFPDAQTSATCEGLLGAAISNEGLLPDCRLDRAQQPCALPASIASPAHAAASIAPNAHPLATSTSKDINGKAVDHKDITPEPSKGTTQADAAAALLVEMRCNEAVAARQLASSIWTQSAATPGSWSKSVERRKAAVQRVREAEAALSSALREYQQATTLQQHPDNDLSDTHAGFAAAAALPGAAQTGLLLATPASATKAFDLSAAFNNAGSSTDDLHDAPRMEEEEDAAAGSAVTPAAATASASAAAATTTAGEHYGM